MNLWHVRCFAIDRSGFVVIHNSFLEKSPEFRVHVTKLEKEIAADMVSNNVLRSDTCVSYFDITNQLFWEVYAFVNCWLTYSALHCMDNADNYHDDGDVDDGSSSSSSSSSNNNNNNSRFFLETPDPVNTIYFLSCPVKSFIFYWVNHCSYNYYKRFYWIGFDWLNGERGEGERA